MGQTGKAPAATAVALKIALTGIQRTVCGPSSVPVSVVAKATAGGIVFLAVVAFALRGQVYGYLAQHAGVALGLNEHEALTITADQAPHIIKLSRVAAEHSLRHHTSPQGQQNAFALAA
jgi:hypothetical protein